MRRSTIPALIAAACAVALAALWYAAFRLPAGARLDREIQAGFDSLGETRAADVAEVAARMVDPAPFAVLAGALVLAAWMRGDRLLSIALAAIIAGAGVTTQVLKRLTEDTRAYEAAGWAAQRGELWPSGHTTAAMTLVLCLVVLVPARRRPLAAAAGGLFAAVVVYSLMILGWHLPSDVAGGFLVAAGWTAGTLATLWVVDPHGRTRTRALAAPAALPVLRWLTGAAVLACAVVAAAALSRPGQALEFAADHSASTVLGPLIGAAGLALAGGAALALRR